MNKKKCDKECVGIIKAINLKGTDIKRGLVVQYEVDGKVYELSEGEIQKPYEKIKLGFITIGYKTKSLIEIRSGVPAMVGSKVKVKYCSSDPSFAFLPDNDEKITWS